MRSSSISVSIDELIVNVAVERERELGDARRIGEEYERTGSYITGQAAASCHRRAEGLKFVLDYAARLRSAGEVRVAELVLAGTLGDKPAARLAKAYPTDRELAFAESLERRPPRRNEQLFDEVGQ